MFKKLDKWREERGLQNTVGNIELNIYEELLEYMGIDDILEDALKEDFSEYIMKDYQRDIPEEEKVDALCDTIVFSINAIEAMGYDAEKSMQETIKEISSRTGSYNPKAHKWEKFKTKESMSKWYKADYNKCKKETK